MAATSSTRWFFSDWLSDPGIRASSLAARGLWKDLLCIMGMNGGREHGLLKINGKPPAIATIARLVQAPAAEVETLLAELEANGVFSRDRNSVVYCRRMVRAEKSRQNGKLGGNPNLLKDHKIQEQDNPTPNLHLPLPIPGPRKKERKTTATDVAETPKRTPEKANRGTRLPEDWLPRREVFQHGQGITGFDQAELMAVVEEFRDYWTALPDGRQARKIDWDKTFINRCRALKGRQTNGHGRSRPLQDDSKSISRAAGRLAEKAERGEFSFGPRPGSPLHEADADVVRLLPPRRGS